MFAARSCWSWSWTAERAKPHIAGSLANVRGWKKALFEEPTPLAAFSELRIPVLYMSGDATRASARGVSRLLTRVLPQVEVVEFPGLGHMGPVTHPGLVNPAIASFLERCAF